MANKVKIEPRALNTLGAADYIGTTEATLRQARCDGAREGRTPTPKHIKIGRSVRYLKEDLDSFLDEMRNNTQSELEVKK